MKFYAPSVSFRILEQTHTLIAGATGCGKSTLIHSVMYAGLGTKDNWFILLDPKMTELGKYKNCNGVMEYACTVDECVDALDTAIALMKRRQEKAARKGWEMYKGNDVYVVIDEIADLLISEQKKRIQHQLQQLLQLARSSRIHLIMGTQSPSRQTIIAPISLNCTCKIGMACDSAIESKQIIGRNGCEFLPIPEPWEQDQTRYMYMKVAGHRQLVEYKVPYIPKDELAKLIKSRPRSIFQGIPS